MNVTSIVHSSKIILLPSFKQEMSLIFVKFFRTELCCDYSICNMKQNYHILTLLQHREEY